MLKFSAGIFLIYLLSNHLFQYQSVEKYVSPTCNNWQKGNKFLAVSFNWKNIVEKYFQRKIDGCLVGLKPVILGPVAHDFPSVLSPCLAKQWRDCRSYYRQMLLLLKLLHIGQGHLCWSLSDRVELWQAKICLQTNIPWCHIAKATQKLEYNGDFRAQLQVITFIWGITRTLILQPEEAAIWTIVPAHKLWTNLSWISCGFRVLEA